MILGKLYDLLCYQTNVSSGPMTTLYQVIQVFHEVQKKRPRECLRKGIIESKMPTPEPSKKLQAQPDNKQQTHSLKRK